MSTKIIVVCDGCGQEGPATPHNVFVYESDLAAQKEGWEVRRRARGAKRQDFCPECAPDAAQGGDGDGI